VALGTSVPELASALAASLRGAGAMVLGTVIGANVANLLLIAGLAGAAGTIRPLGWIVRGCPCCSDLSCAPACCSWP